MKTTSVCVLSCFFGFAAAAFPGLAMAGDESPSPSPGVEVVGSQFGDKIESGRPVGDGKSASLVTYFVEVKNPGDASQVVLVWSHDGKETARQTLDVGRSSKWRTWGMATARGAKTIEVRVLDQGGRELKKDVLER